ncbi:MAG: right-handed parallel beta-helix repeat-containing protein, partial [Planctomycetaceae bacterium]|nr:right-handed parallel beta-helix repeat-containing protein [Planctomycetaceae bacterium]
GLVGVQTFRTTASSGSAVAVTDHVGGETPNEIDAAANSGAQTFATLDNAVGYDIQSVTAVSVSSANISGLDFGFNFDTIVNVNDSGQGSLRQFVTNSNALANTNLHQSGQTAGKEVTIFMIADGQAHAGLNTGYANQLTGTVGVDARAVFHLLSALPVITGANGADTVIDGLTQTTFVGNTNVGTIGANAGSSMTVGVGVDGIAGTGDETVLAAFARPEIEITGTGFTSTLIDVTGSNFTLANIAGWMDGQTHIARLNSSTNSTVSNNLLGMDALGNAKASTIGSSSAHVNFANASTVLLNHNYFNASTSVSGHAAMYGNAATNVTLTGNEVTGVFNTAIWFYNNNSTISGNYFHDITGSGGYGIYSGNVVHTNQTIEHNTISGNVGQGIYILTGQDVQIRHNSISNNGASGVLVSSADPIRTVISKNSIFNNTGLAIDLAGATGVTANDGTFDAAVGNDGIDFPVITQALLSGTTLTVSGYVGIASGDTDFAGATIELYKASADATGYGEGQTYLGTITGSVTNGNFTGSITLPGSVSLGIGDAVTATATMAAYGTSEFGANRTLYSISGTVFEDINGNLLTGAEAIGDSNNPGVSGVTVKLYKDGGDGLATGTDDILIGTTTTAGGGAYSFTIDSGTYWTVIDSKTIVSSTALNSGFTSADTWAEQTYAIAGALRGTGFQPVNGSLYGGRNLETSDNAAALSTSEHVTRVIVSNANVANIDSGFSFQVITRTGDGDDDLSNNRTVQGSLRQFIHNSNAISGSQISNFKLQISDSNYQSNENGQYTISLTSALPTITDSVVIDGTTQDNFVGTPVIELEGSSAGATVNGLEITAGDSTVRGLVINDFTGDGIHISGAGGNTIEGNIIGLRPDGTGVIGGAVSLWKGENNGLDSVGNNDGTLSGGVTFTDGVVGDAFQFDGADDSLSASVTMTPSFTVSVWGKSDTSNWNTFGWLASNRSANGFVIHPESGSHQVNMMVANSSGGLTYVGSSITPTDITQWHLYTLSYDATTGVARTYLDGTLHASQTINVTRTTSASTVYFGKDDPAAGSRYGDGAIDEPAIFSRALSSAEIQAIYNAGNDLGRSPTLTSQVAYLQGEDNASDSRSIVPFNAVGGVDYVDGVVGQAFDFTSASYLDATDLTNISSDTFTYTTWVRTTNAGYERLLAREFADGQGWNLQMNPSTGKYTMRVDTASGTNQSGGTTSVAVNDGQWHFIAVTMDGSTNQVKFSTDGGAFTTASYVGEFSSMTGGHFRVGSGGVGGISSMTGQVDEFQIHNRVLSIEEVTQLYQSGLRGDVANAGDGIEINASSGNLIGGDTSAERNVISNNVGNGIRIDRDGVPNDAVAWWKADGSANDSVGANHGTLTNGATIVAGGRSGSALEFDGIDDHVAVANEDHFDFADTQFSVDLWFQTSVTGTNQYLISKGTGSDWQWGIQIDSGNVLRANMWNATGFAVVDAVSSTTVADGLWHHVTAIFDTRTASEAVTLYVDGVLDSNIGNDNRATLDYNSNGAAAVRLGGRGDGAFSFNGLIDDAAIYARALTAAEIDAIYRSSGGSKGGNVVSGNYIGTDVTGTRAIGNQHGIYTDSSSGNQFGGTGTGEGNLISGNTIAGIRMITTGWPVVGHGTVIEGNLIGTNVTGTAALGGQINGINVINNYDVTIGGDTVAARNIISGNTETGILLEGPSATQNIVQGNSIGTDITGTVAIANNRGVQITNGTGDLVTGNLISGNTTDGIKLFDAGYGMGSISRFTAEGHALDSVLGNDGILYGNTSYTTGVTGQAFSFDGTGDYVELPNESAYDFVEQVFTVEGWFRTSTTGVRQMIVAKGTTGDYQWNIEIQADNTLDARLLDTNIILYRKVSTQTVTDGQWHHFAAAFDTRVSSENVTLYLDGVAQTSAPSDARSTNNYNTSGSQSVRLGSRGDGLAFNGQIDEVAIYSRTLTESEVRQQFQSGGQSKYGNVIQNNVIGRNALNTANLANGNGITLSRSDNTLIGGINLGEANIIAGNTGDGVRFLATGDGVLSGQIGYWKADGSTTDLVVGTSGSLQNGAAYSTGYSNQGFQFDGTDDHVLIGSSAAYEITGNAISFDAWIKPTGPGSHASQGGMILSREGEYQVARFTDGTIQFAINTVGNGYNWVNAGYVAALNEWTHIAVTYDGANAKVYANGTQVYSGAATGNIQDNVFPTLDELRIGGRQNTSQYFQGSIDDVGLYNRALTAEEVAEVYALRGAAKERQSINNSIRGNSIYGNGGLGIDHGDDGVTANDSGDGDYGIHHLQNYPVLATVTTSGSVINLSGSINSLANTTYSLDFYSSSLADASGYGEGAVYLGSKTVTTDGSGNAEFTDSFAGAVRAGDVITATATTVLGSTSEFSAASATTASASILVVDTTSDTADGDTSSISALLADRGADGYISLREAIVATNNSTAAVDNSYLEFDGATDKLHVTGLNLGTEWTMSATVMPTADDPGAYDRIISYGIPGVSEIFEVAYAADGSLAVNSSGVGWKVSTDFDFVFGQTYEVTATLKDGVASVYVDGVEVMRVATPANLTGGTLALMDRVQDTGDTESGVGRVYRFRAWDSALAPSQLATNAANVIDYHFAAADISGATLTDHSGAGNHGTLIGSPTTGQDAALADEIWFDIVGSGPHRIEVGSALSDITDSLLIDGWTAGVQPLGADAALAIEIDGRNTTSGNGLTLTTGTSIIRGLSITNFSGSGIEITGGDAHQ